MKWLITLAFVALIAGCKVVTQYENIYEAAKAGDVRDVRRHLRKGAPIETKREGGKTALHIASSKGYSEVVDILIKAGANIEAEDDSSNSPMAYAVQNGHYNVVEFLINGGAKTDHGLLYASVKNDSWLVFQLLLDEGKLHCDSSQLAGYFHSAVSYDAASIIMGLARRGVDVDNREFLGRSALHTAAELGKLHVAITLTSLGADVNAQDNWGLTPLHCAVVYGNQNIARLLLDKGADMTIKDTKNGLTPLGYAKRKHLTDMVELLETYKGESQLRK
jgi:ankyrin repeat protein